MLHSVDVLTGLARDIGLSGRYLSWADWSGQAVKHSCDCHFSANYAFNFDIECIQVAAVAIVVVVAVCSSSRRSRRSRSGSGRW